MNKDKIKIYLLEIILLIFLFFTLFESNIFSKILLAIFLLCYMFVIKTFLKKRKIISIYNRQVMILISFFAIIYLAVFYLMGIYFGYYNSTVKLSVWSLCNYIIPITIIIISSEIIRYVFLSQKAKTSKLVAFLSMILIDIIVYSQVYDLTKLDDFLAMMGFVLFASISCNLLYNYICNRFGAKPIIIYRLITTLYVYIIPIVPDIYLFFRSVLRMIYPYIIYMVLEYTYSKTNFVSNYQDRKKKIINTTFIFIIVTLITMLVSCKFKYGILVIGSGSMTGSINKGDAVIFESYDNQNIFEGDVIIFKRDSLKVVHRVIDVKVVNGQYQYYTKGDANQNIDDSYVSKKDIVGISKFKIIYIGYPTIWLKDIFS